MMSKVVSELCEESEDHNIDILTEEETTCPICYDVLDRKG
ncbi:Serine/threonine protein kinase [Giardia duodenalis]|nr:Serine/threonine protein kinase [Giardia intestinalis]